MGCVHSKDDQHQEKREFKVTTAPRIEINNNAKSTLKEVNILPDHVWKYIISLCPLSSLVKLSLVCFALYHETKAERTFASYGNVESEYVIGKEKFRGQYIFVREGTNKLTEEKVQIYLFPKKYMDQSEIAKKKIEIKIRHKNVVQMLKIFEDENNISLVMELVTGSELLNWVADKGEYSELEARDIVLQLVEGIDYLHGMGFMHGALMYETVLYSIVEEKLIVKIDDVRYLKQPGFDNSVSSNGTPDFAVPEILRGETPLNKNVDVWSIGIFTYILLCGYSPFYGKSQAQLFEKFLNADFDFFDPTWNYISSQAKDFINHLLVIGPNDRYNIKQCRAHPWFQMAGTELTVKLTPGSGYYINYINKYRNNHWQ